MKKQLEMKQKSVLKEFLEMGENPLLIDRNSISVMCGVETILQSRGRNSHLKDKLLNAINREIVILNEREDLELKLMGNGKKENRFWIFDKTTPNSILVNIKLKGKIFNYGEKYDKSNPPYFTLRDDKQSLIEFLEQIYGYLEDIPYNQPNFWVI